MIHRKPAKRVKSLDLEAMHTQKGNYEVDVLMCLTIVIVRL